MSTIAVKKVKLGDNADTSKNFLIEVPAVADGTLTIKREDGTAVLSIAADGAVSVLTRATLGSSTDKFTSPVSLEASTDLNLVPKVTGLYYGYNGVNTPNATQGIYVLEILVYSLDWVIQRITIINGSPTVYIRAWHSGTAWSAWAQI